MGIVSNQHYIQRNAELLCEERDSFWQKTFNVSSFAVARFGLTAMSGAGMATLATCMIAHFTVGLTLTVPLSLTLTCGSLATFFYARKIVDYGDEEVLNQVRLEPYEKFMAVKLLKEQGLDVDVEIKNLFSNCIAKHGLENMLYYGIPHPQHLGEIFSYMRDHVPFTHSLDTYLQLQNGVELAKKKFGEKVFQLDLVLPRTWKYLFFNEIQRNGYNISEIMTNYDVELLKCCEVISEAQYDVLIQAADHLERMQAEHDESFGERAHFIYEREIEPFESLFKSIELQADRVYKSHACHGTIDWYKKNLATRIAEMIDKKDQAIKKAQDAFGMQRRSILAQAGVADVSALQDALLARYEEEKFLFDGRLESIRSAFRGEQAQILSLYNSQIAPYEQEKREALDYLKSKVARAKERFEEKTAGARRRYNDLRAPFLESYKNLQATYLNRFLNA